MIQKKHMGEQQQLVVIPKRQDKQVKKDKMYG